jgi:hypothetical protein
MASRSHISPQPAEDSFFRRLEFFEKDDDCEKRAAGAHETRAFEVLVPPAGPTAAPLSHAHQTDGPFPAGHPPLIYTFCTLLI